MSKYNLALVEYYHPNIHGSENVKLYSHFFYSLNITPNDFFEDYPDGWISERQEIQEILNLSYNDNAKHPIIENYNNILQKNKVECRPIVTGNFVRNEVMKYFNYEVHKELNNANYLHDNGFFVGNSHKNLSKNIYFLSELLS